MTPTTLATVDFCLSYYHCNTPPSSNEALILTPLLVYFYSQYTLEQSQMYISVNICIQKRDCNEMNI